MSGAAVLSGTVQLLLQYHNAHALLIPPYHPYIYHMYEPYYVPTTNNNNNKYLE